MDKALHEAYAVARSYELHLTPAHHPADPDRAAETPYASLQPHTHTTMAVAGCVPPSTHGALNKVSRLMRLMVVGASRDIMPKAAF